MLDKRTLAILKHIYKHPYIYYSDLKKAFPDYFDIDEMISLLNSDGFISFRVASCARDDEGHEHVRLHDVVHLICLQSGNRAVEDAKNSFRCMFRDWIAVIIAVIALLKSFDQEIISLWKLLAQVWQ